MALISMPTAVIGDDDVSCALSRAVRVINPVVDVLSQADPLGLKGRSHHLGDTDGSVDKALDALAWVLNAADVPGTQAWKDTSLDDRVEWWVRRVGAVDTVLVAFPDAYVDADAAEPAPEPASSSMYGTPLAFLEPLWRVAGLVRATGDELVKRPGPRRVFHYLRMLPAVGAVADYFGEYGALVRAAKAGRKWIAHHPVAVA